MQESSVVAFNQKSVDCGKSPKGYGRTYFAKHNFQRGDIIIHGFGKIINHQTSKISVQISLNKHYLPTKWSGRYWNHSCGPNCFIRTRSDGFPDLVALKDINKGEEITYGYFMTEFSWSARAQERRIVCRCGTKKCLKKILSFSQLDYKHQCDLKKRKIVSSYLYHL